MPSNKPGSHSSSAPALTVVRSVARVLCMRPEVAKVPRSCGGRASQWPHACTRARPPKYPLTHPPIRTPPRTRRYLYDEADESATGQTRDSIDPFDAMVKEYEESRCSSASLNVPRLPFALAPARASTFSPREPSAGMLPRIVVRNSIAVHSLILRACAHLMCVLTHHGSCSGIGVAQLGLDDRVGRRRRPEGCSVHR